MQFLSTLCAAGLAIGYANGFQINFYSDTSCNDYQSSFNGQNTNTDGTTYDFNGYLGAIIVVDVDQWTTEFDTSYNPSECFWYDQNCASGAPSCTHAGNSGNDPDTLTQCLTVDQTVGTVWAGFTVCDASGFDTDYKRDANVTGFEFVA